jgi:hypothetical protein
MLVRLSRRILPSNTVPFLCPYDRLPSWKHPRFHPWLSRPRLGFNAISFDPNHPDPFKGMVVAFSERVPSHNIGPQTQYLDRGTGGGSGIKRLISDRKPQNRVHHKQRQPRMPNGGRSLFGPSAARFPSKRLPSPAEAYVGGEDGSRPSLVSERHVSACSRDIEHVHQFELSLRHMCINLSFHYATCVFKCRECM